MTRKHAKVRVLLPSLQKDTAASPFRFTGKMPDMREHSATLHGCSDTRWLLLAIRYPAIGPGWRDGMQFDQLRRREFITLLGIRSPILPLLYCSPAHECRSEVSAKEKMSCVWWPLSLVWIEQQLTQGDENDGADDRRKEYGGEGNGRFQHVPSVVASASPTQCDTLCKPLVLWATSAARPQHWRPLSVSLTH